MAKFTAAEFKAIRQKVVRVQEKDEDNQIASLALTKTEKAGTIKTLDAIQSIFGKNGEHWIQGGYLSYESKNWDGDFEDEKAVEALHPTDKYGPLTGACLVGAARVANGKYEPLAYLALSLAITENDAFYLTHKSYLEDSITEFNDNHDTEWADVKKVIAKAKRVVAKAEAR